MVKNCWEFKKCGRELGGEKVKEMGVCPAATIEKVDGINHGKNGGRCCWAITGTFCEGKEQGEFCHKFGTCINCDFYKTAVQEEGSGLMGVKEILEQLKT